MAYQNKAVTKTETLVVPASPLDNILTVLSLTVSIQNIKLFDFIAGEELTPKNREAFYKRVVENAKNKIYETTDHLITCVQIAGIYFLYVSLDNSVRSNMNGSPLYMRLVALCEMLNKIISYLNGKCVVFFSESCRPSFLGGMNDKQNLTSWFSMRRKIEKMCSLNYITEKRNNDDQSDMSFGVSVFCTDLVLDNIATYFVKSVLTEGFGSAAVGVKLKSGEIVWGIHFPLDFKGDGVENLNYKTMVNLQNLMKEYKGSVCAIGDFNTIPGKIADLVEKARTSEFEFILKGELTFFGAYYDTIPYKAEDKWVSLI